MARRAHRVQARSEAFGPRARSGRLDRRRGLLAEQYDAYLRGIALGEFGPSSMNARTVCVESDHFRAIATPDGRARCPVFLQRRDETRSPIATESLNLAASKERVAFLQLVPVEDQSETSTLLERLAVEVATVQSAASGRPSTTDPFPSITPWPAEVSLSELLDQIADLARRYIFLPEHVPEVLALWIAHTWVPDASEFTPYLLIISPVRECGKSTTLELLAQLVYRPQLSGGITAAALYRRIDRHRPTILLDELDTRLRGDGGEALRGVLNTGFQRSGRVTLCVGDEHEAKDFSTFGPKALAGIGRPWDTVESRSIKISLSRASRHQLGRLSKIRGDRIASECEPFRQKLSRVADDRRGELRDADPETPPSLSARQADVWRPLFAIADVAGGRWPDAARAAAVAFGSSTWDETDFGLVMLEDVRSLFDKERTEFLNSTQVVDALIQREDRPWPEYRHGQPISTRSVASLLGRFGVKPEQSRISQTDASGKSRPIRGYSRSKLQPIFDTYLTASGDDGCTPPERSGTSGTSSSHTGVPFVPLLQATNGASRSSDLSGQWSISHGKSEVAGGGALRRTSFYIPE